MGKGHDGIGGFLGKAQKALCAVAELRTKEGVIQSWPLDGETESLVGEIVAAAENEAQGVAGALRLLLVGVKDGRDWGRHVLVQQGSEQGVDPFVSTGGDVTMQSFMAELVRDRRETLRMVNLERNAINSRLVQMFELQAVIAEKAEKRHVESLELMNTLLADKETRDARLLRESAEAVRAQRAFDEFVPLVKAGANRLLAQASGNPTIVVDEVVESFVESLSPEEAERLMSVLPPTKQATLLEVFAAYQAKHAAKEQAGREANARAQNGVGNGVGKA